MKYKTQKNITCALITVTCIMLSVTIVVNFYMKDQITSTINGISMLTGTNVKLWGDYPGYNDLLLNKTIKFFSLDVASDKTISNMPAGLDCSQVNMKEGNSYYYKHQVQFKNISLQTGTGGYATYYKNETLVDQIDQTEESQKDILMTVNQGMLQGYYEEVYAPIARKMPLYLYNLKRQMMDTLPTYYAKMMQTFNLGDGEYTSRVVFNPLAINPKVQDKLWNDQYFGWKNKQTLAKWVSIVLSQQYANHPNYKSIQNYFALNNDQMLGLAGKSSMLNRLSWLLNGTLSDAVYEYGQSACQGMGTYCSNSELVSSQWAQGILTKKQIFKYDNNPRNYDFDFNNLNSTIPVNAELGIYSPSPINANDGMNLLQINELTGDMWSPLTVGKTYTLISYFNMANLYNNKDNFGLINFNLKLYNINKVPSLVSYLDNLENNLILKNDTYPGLGNQETVTSAWFQYRAFTTIFNQISDLVIGNLYSRAAYNRLSRLEITCESLFASNVITPISTMIKMCSQKGFQQFNVVKSFSANMPFVYAFIGNQNSQDFKNLMNFFQLQDYQLAYFLYNTDTSPYAKLMAEIQNDMQLQYGCLSFCTAKELGQKQWFTGEITNNLPTKYFYPTENVPSIKYWDQQTLLPQKLLPEIYLYTQAVYQKNITFSVESQENLLDVNTGSILTWSSIHQLTLQIIQGNEVDIIHDFKLSLADGIIIQEYLKHTVVEEIFGGMYIQNDAQNLLWGYKDTFLLKKISWKQIDGGQPWISQTRSLLNKNNWQQAANLQASQVYWINTGLEDMSNVNNIEKIFGTTQLYKYYTVWAQDNTFSNSIQSFVLPYYLNQTVEGSAGFGFQSKIQEDESLTLLNEQYGRVQELSQSSKTSHNSQDVYKYIYDPSTKESKMFYDNIPGMVNVTSAAFNGLFISDLYFKSVNNQTLINNIMIGGVPMVKSQEAQKSNDADTSSYFLVEPQTGKTVKLAQNEQHNLLFTNNLLLDKYHVKDTCFVPFNWNLYNMEYTNSLTSNQFSSMNSQTSSKKALLIAFIVLTCVAFVAACVAGFYTYKKRMGILQGKIQSDSRKNSGDIIDQSGRAYENETSVFRTHNSNNINGNTNINVEQQA